jgi:hypothetical protein
MIGSFRFDSSDRLDLINGMIRFRGFPQARSGQMSIISTKKRMKIFILFFVLLNYSY